MKDTTALRINDILDQSRDMHIITNKMGVIEYVNSAFESFTGFCTMGINSEPPMFLKTGSATGDFYATLTETILSGKAFTGILKTRKRSSEIFHADTTISPLKSSNGEITGYFATMRDVTANLRKLERLEYLANFDELTGLPNRNLFADRLQQALLRTNREKHQMALIYIDMDGFKQINDSYGHECGDKLLKTVASHLQTCVRKDDTVAHLSGDEFAIILLNINGVESVLSVLNKIVYSFGQQPLLDGIHISPTCSIGVALYPRDGGNEQGLLRCADTAMYRAKNSGGNNYCFFCQQDVTIGSEAGMTSTVVPSAFRKNENNSVEHTGACCNQSRFTGIT